MRNKKQLWNNYLISINNKQAQGNKQLNELERERSKLDDLSRFGFPPTSPPQEHLSRIPKSTNLAFLQVKTKLLQSYLIV